MLGGRGLPRPLEAPRAWVSAGILVAVLAGIAAGSPDDTRTRPAVAAETTAAPPVERVIAGDAVSPQPVTVVFAKPIAPGARVTSPRPTRRARVAARAAATPASTTCSGPGWQERRGRQALDSLLHPLPAGATVTFLPGRGALKGLTYYDRHAVEVYVGSCAAESDALLRHVVAHELGHAWDSLHMTNALRADYLAARGIPAGTPWFGCSYCQDFATPAGDFAETYAQWQRGSATSRSRLASAATPSELADLARRFFR